MQIEDVRKFWDLKILQWEKNRYNAGAFGGPLKARRQTALALIENRVQGLRVVEIGCGSAHLAETILGFGAQSYVGIDVSGVALRSAEKRIESKGLSKSIQFINSSVESIDHSLSADIVLSLGLVDWLSKSQLERLARIAENALHVHSYSELRFFSVYQAMHRVYTYALYAHRGYGPRYLSFEYLKKIFGNQTKRIASSEMSFGALIVREGIKL